VSKVLLVATVQSHIAQFHKPLINLLKEKGVTVHVAARDNLAEKNGLKIENADEIFDIPFSRSPLDKKNLTAYKMLKNLINCGEYDVIHCNTPIASVLTRKAAKKARKRGTKVVYTAHGFHFYKGASVKSKLLWYNVEKHYAKKTDVLITINREDYETAKSKFKTNVKYIHGVGVNEKRFTLVTETEKEEIRQKYGLTGKRVLLCTGELNDNKNQKTVISAFAKLCEKHSDLVLLLAGNGKNKEALESLIKELGLEEKAILTGYEPKIEKLVSSADLVLSASIREGLGLNVIEGMVCGLPAVVSDNRGHRDLIENGVNGYRVNPYSPEEFFEKADEILSNGDIYKKFSEETLKKVKPFTTDCVIEELKNIYDELI